MSWSEVGTRGNGGGSEEREKAKYLKISDKIQVRVLDDEPVSEWVHWIPQIENGKGGSVTCLGRGCPVCRIIEEDKKNGRPKKYSSSKKHRINVLNRVTGEVNILNAGETVFDQLKQILMEMGDLKEYDVKIGKTGTGKNTKYSVLPVYPPKPLTAEEKALEKYNLSETNKPLTVEQVMKLLQGKSYKEALSNEEDVPAPGPNDEPDFTQE